MGQAESVRIRPNLVRYKQKGSRRWQARVYMPINGKYVHTLSTKTTDPIEATKRAEECYLDCILWKRGDVAIQVSLINRQDPATRFDRIADAYLDDIELEPKAASEAP